jgi:hypothetical protein
MDAGAGVAVAIRTAASTCVVLPLLGSLTGPEPSWWWRKDRLQDGW